MYFITLYGAPFCFNCSAGMEADLTKISESHIGGKKNLKSKNDYLKDEVIMGHKKSYEC